MLPGVISSSVKTTIEIKLTKRKVGLLFNKKLKQIYWKLKIILMATTTKLKLYDALLRVILDTTTFQTQLQQQQKTKIIYINK